MLFGAADLAFVGGSLVPVGGHNLLEPAAWGTPVLTGPALHNFTAIAALLDEAGALTVVSGKRNWRRRWPPSTTTPASAGVGEAAAGVVAANRARFSAG